jgi:hypothetical protein
MASLCLARSRATLRSVALRTLERVWAPWRTSWGRKAAAKRGCKGAATGQRAPRLAQSIVTAPEQIKIRSWPCRNSRGPRVNAARKWIDRS